MAELIRTGQNSMLLKNPTNKQVMADYAQIFVRLLGSVYNNLHVGQSGISDGLAYQIFYFGEKCETELTEDWSKMLRSIIYKNNTVFQTLRVFHYFEKNKLIIVKPDRLRHWIQSTAIRDADETLDYLYQQGF
jgi:hypothetical protein